MYVPTRALEPLFPRPEVFPRPELSPRPLRWDFLFRGTAEVMSWIIDMAVSRRGDACVALLRLAKGDAGVAPTLRGHQFAGVLLELHAAARLDLVAILK